ncbi:MAG: P1 family peptidase [Acidobacteria bacterium]|nr:P1 family peptidase [Acidobacteriota bacterium]
MEIPGIRIGHATDLRGATGITVALCETGAVCGLDVRGGGSSLRNPTVALPGHRVEKVHAVFFAGGSSYGLDAGGGVMRYLERRGIGFPVRGIRIPIVTGAILFDLGVGNPRRRPDEAMAYRACTRARAGRAAEGSVGAGTGATVGKYFGIRRGMKGGVGTANLRSGRVRVGALAVVNAFGDVRDPETGGILAGARDSARGRRLMGIEAFLRRGAASISERSPTPEVAQGGDSTTLGLVATNAALTREQCCRLATASHVALARCLSPAHTANDGDLVYALSNGKLRSNILELEALAVEALTRSILRAVRQARGLAGIPSRRDLGMD